MFLPVVYACCMLTVSYKVPVLECLLHTYPSYSLTDASYALLLHVVYCTAPVQYIVFVCQQTLLVDTVLKNTQ